MRDSLVSILLLVCAVVLLVPNGSHGSPGTFLINSKFRPQLNKVNAWSNKSGSKDAPIFYLVPHADDETLTYGIDILNSIRAGRRVKLVLLSKGVASAAFDVLNGRNSKGEKVFDSVFNRYHNPIEENYQNGYLTREAFGAARIREYEQASLELGVEPSNISFINGLHRRDVVNLVQETLKMYPNAEFRTMAKEDAHAAHALLGRVLQSFVDRHRIQPSKVRYLVSVYTDRFDKQVKQRVGDEAYLAFKKQEITEYLVNSSDTKRLQAAINVYKKWDPPGWYAIGYHSVPEQFLSLEKGMYTRYYLAQAGSEGQVSCPTPGSGGQVPRPVQM